MKYRKAFTFLISLSITFSILGGAIGYIIGSKFPQYYKSVFFNGQSSDFDPIAVGIGQGISQGFIGGVIAALITIFVISKSKQNQDNQP